MKSLIILMESDAPSFCYYESVAEENSKCMSLAVFEMAIEYAKKRQLSVNLVCGPAGLDPERMEILQPSKVPYICYMSAGGQMDRGDRDHLHKCVPVVNAWESDNIDHLKPGVHLAAVLRVRKPDLANLPNIWERLARRVYRVVWVVLGQEQFEMETIELYEETLQSISQSMESVYLAGKEIELNAISDRMALREPAHCSAGVDHVTVGPSGNLHICPGFASQGEPSVGDLESGPEIPNGQLLDRAHAPLCSICDAFHCRRCVHLNQVSTLEVNTPPWQFCRTAHVEREASRKLLDRLHSKQMLSALPAISPLKYCDPLDAFLNFNRRIEIPQIYPSKKRIISTKRPKEMTETTARHPKRLGTGSLILTKELLEKTSVGRVTAEESEQIRALHLRRVALADLFLGLVNRSREELEGDSLYEEITMDMGSVSIAFQDWWDGISKKYKWKADAATKWRIQFESRQVFIEDPSDVV